VLPPLFLAAVNLPTLGLVAALVGMGIAPTLITAFGLVESLVPNAALTEGMASLVTGISVGFGIASSIVGRIADAHSARTAFSVAIGAGVLVCVLAALLHARLDTMAEAQPVGAA
jgi:MFS family permease